MPDPQHERRVKQALLWAFVLCGCALIPPLLSLVGGFKPQAEPTGQWFQRSGAVMTVFALFAQFKTSQIAAMIAGGTFAESWEAYHKYRPYQALTAGLSLVLTVFGAAAWGYGDLLYARLGGG